VVLSTFVKLVGGSRSQVAELSVDEYLKQAREYERAAM
jgi:hypothetical protein